VSRKKILTASSVIAHYMYLGMIAAEITGIPKAEEKTAATVRFHTGKKTIEV